MQPFVRLSPHSKKVWLPFLGWSLWYLRCACVCVCLHILLSDLREGSCIQCDHKKGKSLCIIKLVCLILGLFVLQRASVPDNRLARSYMWILRWYYKLWFHLLWAWFWCHGSWRLLLREAHTHTPPPHSLSLTSLVLMPVWRVLHGHTLSLITPEEKWQREKQQQ